MITGDLIQRRIDSFWGYGSLEAPVWFVGMEEGLAPTVSEAWLQEGFRATAGKITVDMRRDMARVPDHMCWFRKGANVQSTWRLQIELYLYLKNHRKRADKERKEEIRSYQKSWNLAILRKNKRAYSILCLFPLANPINLHGYIPNITFMHSPAEGSILIYINLVEPDVLENS